jgi:hypothetical protein
VALVAGLAAALYWPLVYFEGEVLIEPVFIALVTLSLWRIARSLSHPTMLRLVVAGVCVGLAALARPTVLVLLPMLPFVFAARAGKEKGRAWVRQSLAVTAACVVVLLPATIHNMSAGRALVPVTWSGALNFYIGNNAQSDGRSSMLPGATTPWMGGEDEAIAIASAQSGDSLGAAQASRFYSKQAWDFIGSQPSAAVALSAKKAYMFVEGPERSNEKYIYFFWDRFGLGRIPMPGFWLVSPLAVVGMLYLLPRRRELALLYGFVIAYALGVIVFFVVARYRLPIVPGLIVFAAWTGVELVGRARARHWRSFASMLGLAAVVFAGVNASYPEFLRRRSAHVAISHYTLAGAYTERGDHDAALVELWHARDAFERAPSVHYAGIAQDIYYKLGTMLHERGKCAEAIKALGQIQGTDPRAHHARFLFADCCERTGRFHEAGKAYELVLQLAPDDRHALEGYIRCLERTGQWDKAADARAKLPPD